MVKKMVISGRIILIMTMLAVLLPVLATAATVNVAVSTDQESYAVGETIIVTVRMNTGGASAIDSRLYVSSSTAGAASFVSGSGEYGNLFATRGVAPANGLSGSRWHFFSGANTPAVSPSALTTVFTFQMLAETAGTTTLAVDSPSSAPAAGDTSVSTVLERVGAPPRFTRTYHTINPASAAITITEVAAASSVPACTDECTASGALVCAGLSAYRECGNFDSDICLELGSAIRSCPDNGRCTGGVCAAAAAAVCGNNLREGTEVCDGTDLAGETCASQQGEGYTGTLACKSSCAADVGGCIAPSEDGGGGEVVPAVDRLQQLQNDVGTAINEEAPEREGRREWTPRLVARLARLLRDFFS